MTNALTHEHHCAFDVHRGLVSGDAADPCSWTTPAIHHAKLVRDWLAQPERRIKCSISTRLIVRICNPIERLGG